MSSRIIFIDSTCALCTNFACFYKRNVHHRVNFVSLQSKEAKAILGKRWSLDSVILLEPDGKHYTKSTAVLRCFWEEWSVIGWICWLLYMIIPRFLRDLCYVGMGSYRYALFGKVNQENSPCVRLSQEEVEGLKRRIKS